MYTPEGRTGRTPERLTRVVAAVAVALMGLVGVAAAAPKGEPGPPPEREPGPPPQAQPNGLPDQAQPNGLPPQAQDPEPAPQGQANGHGRKARGAPAEIPRELPPQAGGMLRSFGRHHLRGGHTADGVRNLAVGRGEMLVPEKRHLFLQRAPRVHHAKEPPLPRIVDARRRRERL